MEVKIKTLSPIFIGGSNAGILSPYSDYVQVDDKIILIDQNKLTELLSKDNSLIEEFVKGIRNMDQSGTRSNFSLINFIDNKLKIPLDDLKKEEYNVIGNIGKNSINRTIDSSGRYFIPGSSLKGAIRTSIYYFWLKTSEEGKNKIDDLIKEVNKLYTEKISLEEENKATRLDNEKSNKLKELSKPSFINNKLSTFLDEKLLFGDINSFELRNFQVTDSEFIKKDNIVLSNSMRFNLGNAKSEIPIWNLCLNKNIFTKFEISLNGKISNPELNKLLNLTTNSLFSCINTFSKDSLSFEINIFESINNTEVKDALSGIIEYYQYLLNQIDKSQNKFCILRLGAGKTYFDNSIGLLIFNKDNEAFSKYKMLLGIGKVSKYARNNLFPVTRSFYNLNGALYPPGWIAMGQEIDNINFEISKTQWEKTDISLQNPLSENSHEPEMKNKNWLCAEIIDTKTKPPIVKIIDGEHKDETTTLPGVNLENLSLGVGSKVLVELSFNKKKKIEKADYKGKVEE